MGARLQTLDGLAKRTVEAIVEKQIYKLTPSNLRVAADLSSGASIGLNTLLEASSDVYAYALANLPEYLAGLANERDQFSLDDAADNESILSILDNAEVSLPHGATEVTAKANPRLRVASIKGGSATTLEALASAHLFEPTFENVIAYEDTVGMDERLRDILVQAGRISQTPDDVGGRTGLALRLINDDSIPVGARVSLAQSLSNEPVPLSRITTRAVGIIGALLSHGLLEESAASFGALAAAPHSQAEFAVASSDPMAYLPSVGLSGEVVGALLREATLSPPVREWILHRLPDEPSWWLGSTFDAVAALLEYYHDGVPPELAQRAISTDASTEAKVSILVACAHGLSAEAIEEHVMRLPPPYGYLAERGTKSVDIPRTPNVEPLLEVLSQDDRAVSSWSVDGSRVRVWRRR
jgi:hypothetical protein